MRYIPLVLAALGLTAYLALWPVPIEPVRWQPSPAPGYTGVHAPDTRLAKVSSISLNGAEGPEHVVVGPRGILYTGLAGGAILRIKPDGSAMKVFSELSGRPLGMAFDADNQLIVADALMGLISIDETGRRWATLVPMAPEGPLVFPNAVVVTRNGKIYFTDSSMRFSPAQWGGTVYAATLDVLEQSATGRVWEYDPPTKAARVVATGLSFANGIALSSDEASLFVSESGKYRVWKIAVAGERVDVARPSAQAQVLLDNLPGYPDNLTRGLDGRIWLGFGGPRNDLDSMAQRPWMRKVIARIPRMFLPRPASYGHVIAFTEDGKVVADLQDPSSGALVTTGATETAGRLYIHNVDGKSLGWLAL